VSTQLCLALSDLAIQMPEWENVVQGMIDRFGSDAQTVGVLLAFLKCLVEESGNPRIAISVRPSPRSPFNQVEGDGQRLIQSRRVTKLVRL
jgi:transportin-3